MLKNVLIVCIAMLNLLWAIIQHIDTSFYQYPSKNYNNLICGDENV